MTKVDEIVKEIEKKERNYNSVQSAVSKITNRILSVLKISQVVIIVLKIFNLISISWMKVFIPTWIILGLAIMGLIALGLGKFAEESSK